MSGSDYVGIATLITAFGAAIVSIIVALRQRQIEPVVQAIHEQVATSNGETLAHIVEGNDLRDLDPADPPGHA